MARSTVFPEIEMPDLPEGWTDSTWHNDACASYTALDTDNGRLIVWIDAENPDDREIPEGKRYMACYGDNDGIESDDWQEILAYCKALIQEIAG